MNKRKLLKKKDGFQNKKIFSGRVYRKEILFKIIWKNLKRMKKFQIQIQNGNVIRNETNGTSSKRKRDEESKEEEEESKLSKNDIVHTCPVCLVNFKYKQNLNRHIKNVHQEENNNRKWKCNSCFLKFYHAGDLAEHQKSSHNAKINSEHLEFDDYESFLLWKEEMELKSYSYFSKVYSAADSQNNMYERFQCQFHGSDRVHSPIVRKGLRKNRKKGKVKTNSFCMSSMTVRSLNSKIHVYFRKSHDHLPQIENVVYQPTPKSVEKEAENLLKLGVPADEVHNRLTDEPFERSNRNVSDFTRKDFVKLQDIRNIENKIKKSKRMDEDERSSLEKLVDKWAEEKNSPVLVFKTENEMPKYIPPLEEYESIADERFIFGFSSLQQRQTLRRAEDQMIFLDTTHGSNWDNFQLLNILVKINGRGFPVAFFLISDLSADTITLCLNVLKAKTDFAAKGMMM